MAWHACLFWSSMPTTASSNARIIARAPTSMAALSNAWPAEKSEPIVHPERACGKGWRVLSEDSALLCSLSKLLADNHDLLACIGAGKAKSIAELARAVGRAESNVSRSLSKLNAVGLLKMESIAGRRGKRPVLLAPKTRLCINLTTGSLILEGFF